MPKVAATHCVTTPDRPSSRITARPITKGGVMMGSSDSDLKKRLNGSEVRTITSAKARPSRVLRKPTVTASANEFHAAPHCPRPSRQPRRQILGSTRRSAKAASAEPSSERSPANSICTTGSSTNSPTSATISPSVPATKGSWTMRPLADRPQVSMNRKAVPHRSAP